jgi:hypothetical protein
VSSSANPFGFSTAAHKTLLDRAGKAGVLLDEYNYDPGQDRLIIKTSQDVEPIFDQNKELQNEGLSGDGYSESGDLRRVASIPLVIVHKWLSEEGLNVFNDEHWPKIKRKLNDPEYRHLRTSLGRI